MHIVLEHPSRASDHGPSVMLSEPIDYLCQDDVHYLYIKTPEGVFRRSVNYWHGSPYGWRRILPCHCDKWGFPSKE